MPVVRFRCEGVCSFGALPVFIVGGCQHFAMSFWAFNRFYCCYNIGSLMFTILFWYCGPGVAPRCHFMLGPCMVFWLLPRKMLWSVVGSLHLLYTNKVTDVLSQNSVLGPDVGCWIMDWWNWGIVDLSLCGIDSWMRRHYGQFGEAVEWLRGVRRMALSFNLSGNCTELLRALW